MNILHLRYAVEVASTGSINKAAENLYMNQPNLSRAIKELEENLGIAIFERTTRGMIVTFTNANAVKNSVFPRLFRAQATLPRRFWR